MRSKTLILFVLLLSAPMLTAQRWMAEFRPGINFPTSDFISSGDYKLGYGFEATLHYSIMPHLKASGGWSWNSFNSNDESNPNADLSENSFILGLELQLPISEPPLTYHVFARSLIGQISYEDKMNQIDTSSGYGLGWEIGGGLGIWLDESWSIRPDVRYRSLSSDLTVSGMQTEAVVNYIGVGVGIARNF